jgi:Na+/H+-translocating membrane pyrophosphatase
VFVGAMMGAMLVFLFSSMAIKAVGEAAQTVIAEVRRQFKEKPGIMKGTEEPDYGQCVDIVTIGALKQMILPGLLATAGPVLGGLMFRMFITPENPTIAAEAVAAGHGSGASSTGASFAQRVSPVCVWVSLVTTPMSPATTSGTVTIALPLG